MPNGDPRAEDERIDAALLSLLLSAEDQRPWAVEEIQREIGDPLAVRNAVQTDTWKRIPPPAGRVLRRRYWVREDVDAWPGRRFQLEEAVVRAAAEPRTGPSR